MIERYMVDDAGTLIDIETRNTYDYVSEICPILNELVTENRQLHEIIDKQSDRIITLANENTKIQNTIKEALANERTEIGKNVLRQLMRNLEWLNGKYKEAEYTETDKATTAQTE